ncbi:bifunctional folylpolyglutamate synthase/dihydrofolate synthase [Heyndrickxia oleronia]|uniref:bifunctional folylpolyglutamate synthase/dihydrofolate synthase n=1 Tax=Heyndrickxia oleronia TaxID=38875 RepID=UPI0020407CAA|nr:folylpolyglutamate synthase/dihydrofolate synthase family protein [Heyndrickxia oleronia]MCM3237165.1 bifunctional folylpolyglutamate synthase/dihydrofolate synthase [Heyndrickxia oleronia]
MKTYDEAIHWINSRLRFGIKPGLERMQWMMKKLGSPEKKLKVIHIGGTNGKGSTVTYLRSILNEAGLKVGTFTSPYIETFNERISVNGAPIKDEEIIQLVNVIKPLVEEIETTELGTMTEFEVITAMAIYYFANMNPMDINIFEVGLGGRLDSTNILVPIMSIITNIGMDHMNILGNTVEEIATEKAGIIKKDTPIITGAKQEEALNVFIEKSKLLGAKLLVGGKDFAIDEVKTLKKGEQFSYHSAVSFYKNIEISMLGHHQVENASLAITAADFLKMPEYVIREGLKKAFWPGRMEMVSEKPVVILDGAHNPEGVLSLVQTLEEHFPNKRRHIVFAALRDKELEPMLKTLASIDSKIYFTQFDSPRITEAEEFLSIYPIPNAKVNSNWRELIEKVYMTLTRDEVLIISGSLYFISEVKPYLRRIIKENY